MFDSRFKRKEDQQRYAQEGRLPPGSVADSEVSRVFFMKKERVPLDLKRWLHLQGVLVLSYLPWTAKVIEQHLRKNTVDNSWIPLPSFPVIKDSLKTFAGSFELMYLFLIFAVFAIAYCRKKQDSREGCFPNAIAVYLAAVWFITPVVLPVIISFIFKPVFVARYAIAATPGLYIMTARGIQNTNTTAVKYGLIMLIAALSLLNVRTYYERIDKQQWRGAITYVGESAKTGDKIIFLPGGPFNAQIWDYYSQRKDVIPTTKTFTAA